MEKTLHLLLCVGFSLAVLAAGRSRTRVEEPLQIGGHKQLFIDGHILDSMENLSTVLHSPRRHSANPMVVGDQPWERWVVEVNGRPVLYDDEAREFKMYYVAPLLDKAAPSGIRYKTCY